MANRAEESSNRGMSFLMAGWRRRLRSAAPRPERLDFDALALDLAAGLSRRQALARLGGVLLGALVASLETEKAWAACQPGETLCGVGDIPVCCPAGQLCLDRATRTCGLCTMDSQCPAGQVCCSGTCQALCGGLCCNGVCCNHTCFPIGSNCCDGAGACPPFVTCCANQYCADLDTDVRNCGACGFACMSGQSCSNGQCICPEGQTRCSGQCVNLQSDRRNCGQCGSACEPGLVCCNGACLGCPPFAQRCCGSHGFACCSGPGVTCCDGVCCPAGTQCVAGIEATFCAPGCESRLNCPAGEYCAFGVCCPLGTFSCNGQCVILRDDPHNCGVCGKVCPFGLCANGRCVCQGDSHCAAGEVCRNGLCHDCGEGCPSGVCTGTRCACGSIPGTDGRGGSPCPAGEYCAFGVCCPLGTFPCNGQCVVLRDDPHNCGLCGKVCPFGLCANGRCVCQGDSQCAAGEVCRNGLCSECLPSGDTCSQGRECCSRICRRSPLTGARFCA